MILVDASREGAGLVAKRLQAAVADDPACCGVTISFGTAMLDAADPVASVESADIQLYKAKLARADAS